MNTGQDQAFLDLFLDQVAWVRECRLFYNTLYSFRKWFLCFFLKTIALGGPDRISQDKGFILHFSSRNQEELTYFHSLLLLLFFFVYFCLSKYWQNNILFVLSVIVKDRRKMCICAWVLSLSLDKSFLFWKRNILDWMLEWRGRLEVGHSIAIDQFRLIERVLDWTV